MHRMAGHRSDSRAGRTSVVVANVVDVDGVVPSRAGGVGNVAVRLPLLHGCSLGQTTPRADAAGGDAELWERWWC